jgi:hypothetical protein
MNWGRAVSFVRRALHGVFAASHLAPVTPCLFVPPLENPWLFVLAAPEPNDGCRWCGDYFRHFFGSRGRSVAQSLPKHIQEMLYAEEHSLLCDRLGRSIHRLIELGVASSFEFGELHRRVEQHQRRQLRTGPFRIPGPTQGNLILGFDLNGRPIRCPSQFLNEHSLTVAASGSGKTTKSKFMIVQQARLVPGIWLFDFRKREFAALKPCLAKIGIELVLVPARKMQLNVLQVPTHCDPREFAPNLADTFVRVLGLPPRAAKLLHMTILNLYGKHNVLTGKRTYPTLFDLREAINANKKAHPESRNAVLAALDPILMSIPEVLRFQRGWDSSDLARFKIAFDLSGVSEIDTDLLLNYLLVSEFMSRISRQISNPRHMSLWICCDEAARLCSGQQTCLTDMIGLVRGGGTGIDLSTQSGDLARPIMSNTVHKFIGRCANATEYDAIGRAMALTAEQRSWLTTHLVPGLFVGSMGQGRELRRPFLFRIPPLADSVRAGSDMPNENGSRAPSSLTDSVDSVGVDGLGPLNNLQTMPATEFDGWTPDWAASSVAAESEPTVGKPHGSDSVGSPETNEAAEPPSLDEDERRFLQAVVDHPAKPSSQYQTLARMGHRKAHQMRQQLVERGLLRQSEVNTKSRGRASILLIPTEQGLLVLNRNPRQRK